MLAETLGLYVLIISGGSIVGTIGPTPNSYDHCQNFVEKRMVEKQKAINSGKLKATSDIKFTCEYRRKRPSLGERYIEPLGKGQRQ